MHPCGNSTQFKVSTLKVFAKPPPPRHNAYSLDYTHTHRKSGEAKQNIANLILKLNLENLKPEPQHKKIVPQGVICIQNV